MSTEERFDRLLSDMLDEDAPTQPPDRLLPETQRALRHVHRWPRWLALLKEPPMRISSRVSVGSPTARMAAIAVATLLLAVMATGAVIGGSQLLAGPGIIVVAQDGSGDYTTITEAVDAARDGHTILVRPGTYTEAIVISDDLKLTGDAEDPSLVVIRAPVNGPTYLTSGPSWVVATTLNHAAVSGQMPYSMLLVDTETVVSGLTVEGRGSRVIVHGGAPRLEGLVLDDVGCPHGSDVGCKPGAASIVIQARSQATLDGNTLLGCGQISVVDASAPLIKANTLTGGSVIWGFPGDEAVIRDNTINGGLETAIHMGGPSTVTIEHNTIVHTPIGVAIGDNIDRSLNAIVRDNDVSGAHVGINVVSDGGRPTIEGNELGGNDIGITIARSDATVSGNHVHGSGSGVTIDHGSPSLEGNTIEDNGVGIAILTHEADPRLTGNTLCGNETNFRLMRGAKMPATNGNDICPDAVAAVSE